jgi:protein SCO1/2
MLSAAHAGGQADATAEARLQAALNQSQSAIGRQLPDLVFTDTSDGKVHLASFRGRPLLVTMVYTSCADVCPTLVENLYPVVKQAQEIFGPDGFSVVTVGFDVGVDSPKRMTSFARRHGALLANWHFLAGDEANVNALAKAIGFGIYASGGGFDHAAQISLVDRSGIIRQQLYGAIFETPAVIEPLKDIVYGRYRPVASFDAIVDRIKLFCTVYDPNTGRYYFNYSIFIGLAIGGLSLSLVGVMLLREWRKTRAPHGEPT